MSDLREIRLEKAKALKALGHGPYALKFQVTHHAHSLQVDHKDLPNGQERKINVAVAGRVMSRRVIGKIAFFVLADETGTLQLFLEKATMDNFSEGSDDSSPFAQLVDLVDSGDWIGVRGILRRTDRGELSVKVHSWQILTKSLQPLPDK